MLVFYSGLGRWHYDDVFSYDVPVKIALGGLAKETGLFKIGDINSQEVKRSKRSIVYYLKPDKESDEGVKAPFSVSLGALDIPYFEPSTPFEITNEDIVKRGSKEKLLTPKGRDRSELLLLLYEMFEHYGLRVGIDDRSKLSAGQAWASIVSGEFKSEAKYIKSVHGSKSSEHLIILNDGTKLEKKKFTDKFNRRFR